MAKAINLTGQRFGRLFVVQRANNINGKVAWECKCDCGKDCIVLGTHLRSGHTQSCGCLKTERVSKAKKEHGMSGSRQYSIWTNMKNRCNNVNDPAYHYYGKRGIKVCDEWANNFQAFYDWAMSNGYDDDLTLDRIDTNGNYSPDNC